MRQVCPEKPAKYLDPENRYDDVIGNIMRDVLYAEDALLAGMPVDKYLERQ